MCVHCMWERLESRSVKTIMCSKLLVSMSGLCASEGRYVATSQADYGTLNHAEWIKKTAFDYSSESKTHPSMLSYFYENKANSFSVISLYIYRTLMILLISLLLNKCLPVCS